MRKIILIGLLVLESASLAAQTRTFAWYDKYTYDAYQRKDWNEVITVGKEAIEDGFDFFYLRLRIGIAYYEQEKYRASIPYFEKALEFNSDDPLTVEYLYYAYKFSGRALDAGLVYSEYKPQAKSRSIKSPNGFVTGFYSEAGLKMIGPSTPDFGTLKYVHIGAQQQLGSRLNLYQGYARISQNIYNNEWVSTGQGFRQSYVTLSTTKYVQNEYYAKATFPILKGLQLVGSIHLQSITDTVSYNNQAFLGGISTSFKPLDIYASYGFAEVNSIQHNQFTLGSTIYPTLNMNMYIQTTFTYHSSEGSSNTVAYGKLGLRTGKNTWFEFYGSFGDLRNVQELDGFYFYNLTDKLRNRAGVTSIFLLGKKVKLFAGYSIENHTEETNELDYKQHYLFTGLKFELKN
ncbi:MAG: hypothetical protein KDC79_02475 [Cyclobacteriaceae bacterium]|nr:hypothetical protein [Cyclobacteriaceae bacterium]